VLDELERIVVAPTIPDLTIIVDVPVEVGLARADARRSQGALDPYEARTKAFHERLRAGFLDIARAEPKRCAVVDGTRAADAVSAEVWSVVQARLMKG
jgi:dTMP kinase